MPTQKAYADYRDTGDGVTPFRWVADRVDGAIYQALRNAGVDFIYDVVRLRDDKSVVLKTGRQMTGIDRRKI